MKLQDILFFTFFLFLLYKNNEVISIVAGIVALFLAIPFFVLWIFFTAQHLVMYAACFILLAIIQLSIKYNHENRH